jgi:hypothetical protein
MNLTLSLIFLLLSPSGSLTDLAIQGEKPKQGTHEDVRKEFSAKEAALKEADVVGHVALAKWAAEKGLAAESKRLLKKVVTKLDPENEEARTLLGYVKQGDKWVLEEELKGAEDEQKKKEGYVKVKGQWVKKEEEAFARKGLVKHEDKWITSAEKKKIDTGWIRHPETGEWIPKEEAEKSKSGLFFVNKQWVDKATADKFHESPDSPWSIYSDHFNMIGTLPYDTMWNARNDAESAMTAAKRVFSMHTPIPVPPLQIRLFNTSDDYSAFTQPLSDTGLSMYGAYYAEKHDEKPVAVFYGEKNWGPYYLRHGVGLMVAYRFIEEADSKLPHVHWFPTGIGSYVSRWDNKGHAQHFGKQYIEKGGVRNLKKFFKSFNLDKDMPDEEVQWNIYQAGILISFCIDGGDKASTEALKELTDALVKAKGVDAAMKNLETKLSNAEKALKGYLEKLVSG